MKKSEKRKNIKRNSNLDNRKNVSDDSLEQVSGGVYRPELRSLDFHDDHRYRFHANRKPELIHRAGIPGRIEPR